MRLFKYLSTHMGAVALVLLLLVGQAFCDLMLPNYTARIVDVGIQQAGIEHVSPDRLTLQTHDAIEAQLSGDDLAQFDASYELAADGESYSLVRQTSQPSQPSQTSQPSQASQTSQPSQPSQANQTSRMSQSREQLDEIMAVPLAVAHGMAQPDMDAALAEQVGIAAARAEYEALGYDVAAMQLQYLLITAAKMMGFVALSVAIGACVGLVAARTGAKIGRTLRSRMFSKVMSFSDAEVQRFSAASLITRGTNDIQQIQMMCIMTLRMVLYAPILGIGGVIMVARTNLSMGWIIGVAVLAIVIVVLTLMMLAMPKFKIMQKLVDRVNLVSREMLTGVSVVRAFGQQAHEQERFDIASTDLMRTQLFTNRVMTFLMPTMFLIMNAVSLVIVWVGASAIDAGEIQTGDLIAFITYAMIVIMGFLMLSMLAIIAPRADVAAQRIDEVLEAEVSITDPDIPVEMPSPEDAARRSSGEGNAFESNAPAQSSEASLATFSQEGGAPGATIEFDHVSFGYDADSEHVLSDITFTAEAGKTCAIIGATGSGKSTILKLVERFYDVSEGAVRIDGIDVRDLPLHELRAQLGYVPQRAFLFTGTIASNVGYAQDEPDEALIREALDIAQATEFVESKDEGLQAEISQGGTNVSGGQRQRLAIARALATPARALLFDDSFSALDYKTDAALRRALAERLPGKTQIIVAQRIATVMRADKIVVLDEGRIVGQGTHAQLLESCRQYREIAYSQLSPEELDLSDAADSEDVHEVSSAASASAQGLFERLDVPAISPMAHPAGRMDASAHSRTDSFSVTEGGDEA